MKLNVDRELFMLGLLNAAPGAVIDRIEHTHNGQVKITWHMPDDPIASGKIFLPKAEEGRHDDQG